MITVGIPRALLYHKFRVLWEHFFAEVGSRVVISPPTDRRILARGVDLAVDESCLPMKMYLGHVDALAGSCDVVLVPRLECLLKREEACVKLMGAYDIVRNTLPELPLETYQVDVRNGLRERDEMIELGRRLGAKDSTACRAYDSAHAAWTRSRELRAASQRALAESPRTRPRILVVAHPYNLHDEMIGRPILDFLATQDVDVLISDDVDHERAHASCAALSPGLIWTFNKELLGSVEMYRGNVDGVVFVVTFPCGPDSLMAELAQRKLGGVPVISIVLDELSGEAGLRTRLESFVDILAMRAAAS